MRKMNLDLTNNETQYILNCLAERPFKESALVIQKIMDQVEANAKSNALDAGGGGNNLNDKSYLHDGNNPTK